MILWKVGVERAHPVCWAIWGANVVEGGRCGSTVPQGLIARLVNMVRSDIGVADDPLACSKLQWR